MITSRRATLFIFLTCITFSTTLFGNDFSALQKYRKNNFSYSPMPKSHSQPKKKQKGKNLPLKQENRAPAPQPVQKSVAQPAAATTPFNGFKFDIFVDANTSISNGDGSIAKPFKTIQAAINHICARPVSTIEDSYSILIADGVYREDLIINGNNKRISLVAINHVTLGTSPSKNSITLNMTDESSTINPELAIHVLTQNTSILNTIPGMNRSYSGQFHIEGNIQVNNNSSYPLSTNLFLTGAYVHKKLMFTSKGQMNEFGLFVCNSTIRGINPTQTRGINLNLAERSHFTQEIYVDNFGYIFGCSIGNGMKILSQAPLKSGVGVEPEGIVLTKFSGTFSAPKGTNLHLDSYTSHWFESKDAAQPHALAPNVNKVIF